MAKELDPVMLDRETGAGGHPSGQSPRMGLGDGRLDVHDAPAAETREVMVGSNVGVVTGRRSGQLTDESRVHELPEVTVDRAEAHPWRSAGDQAVDLLGGRVCLGASDDLEHRVTRSGQSEASAAQRELGALDAQRVGVVLRLSGSRFGSDSHFQLQHLTGARLPCQDGSPADPGARRVDRSIHELPRAGASLPGPRRSGYDGRAGPERAPRVVVDPHVSPSDGETHGTVVHGGSCGARSAAREETLSR